MYAVHDEYINFPKPKNPHNPQVHVAAFGAFEIWKKVEELNVQTNDGAVMQIWRECGLPEYFLGNNGTNHNLVEFAKRIGDIAYKHGFDDALAEKIFEQSCRKEPG